MELSDEGMRRAALARDAFTLKLMEYIENTRPELNRHQQLDRLSKLLGVIKEIKKVSTLWRVSMTDAVFHNHGGLNGKFTFDLYVNSKQ